MKLLIALTYLFVFGPEGTPIPSPQKCDAPVMLSHKHSTLQKNLVKALRKHGLGRAIDSKALAVAVVDLSRKKRLYYAGVNDNEMMYAASLPKIAVLLSVIERVRAGKLNWSHEYDRRLQNMIVASSNSDASWGVDQATLTGIADTMKDPKYCFYDSKYGGLWVGRAFRRGGATQRDPLHNISHGATARQAARFYAMLGKGKLVSPHWSFRMLGLMAPPKHYHKFVGALHDREGLVFLARKSGTWRHFHADSALIQHFGRQYVLVGLSELRSGEKVMREVAGVVDDLIVKGKHRAKPKRRRRSKNRR